MARECTRYASNPDGVMIGVNNEIGTDGYTVNTKNVEGDVYLLVVPNSNEQPGEYPLVSDTASNAAVGSVADPITTSGAKTGVIAGWHAYFADLDVWAEIASVEGGDIVLTEALAADTSIGEVVYFSAAPVTFVDVGTATDYVFPTIQAAINAAAALGYASTVILDERTYIESIDYKGIGLYILDADAAPAVGIRTPTASTTCIVVDAGVSTTGLDAVVTFQSAVPATVDDTCRLYLSDTDTWYDVVSVDGADVTVGASIEVEAAGTAVICKFANMTAKANIVDQTNGDDDNDYFYKTIAAAISVDVVEVIVLGDGTIYREKFVETTVPIRRYTGQKPIIVNKKAQGYILEADGVSKFPLEFANGKAVAFGPIDTERFQQADGNVHVSFSTDSGGVCMSFVVGG